MKKRPAARPLAAALALALAPAAPALAMQFEFANGIKANLDTTVTYGISIRASERDPALIGIANGGTSRSVNEDDGDLNFEKGKAFANVIKATSELEIKWKNWGFFGRGYALYDFDLHDSSKLGPVGQEARGVLQRRHGLLVVADGGEALPAGRASWGTHAQRCIGPWSEDAALQRHNCPTGLARGKLLLASRG